ncbi:M61 family metallopeptidase [Xanthovirga aplysinae]|uniref:M61 family metallopeptidase n=1 Tax=Xanthovirga aplysinae TaxID=2529853 RepID=UPI0012BB688B|nr:M61 family peptidase [Xanthovirga aplysinae]MTI31330.1 M61 family peptidase [Xanthovirga aplysinae]
MHYIISYKQPHRHFIDICLFVDKVNKDKTVLQLPSWRPGRYELANFAKNIQHFQVENEKGESLPFRKITKDRWEVDSTQAKEIRVNYNYYAYQMNAGSSWLDEELLYINFINCMMYVEDRMKESCQVHLELPDNYEIACGLEHIEKHKLFAVDYYRLVDSPMIASPNLKHLDFKTKGHHFHLWFSGEFNLDDKKVLKDFKSYTDEQIDSFGEFPCPDYHYLFHLLPYKHYNGVEHFNSTVITLGPSEDMQEENLYNNLLGVSSHELFHTWNVIRIRPKEMMPYDFTKENYHRTGFITEGVTTYYGDLFLVRSEVFDIETYFDQLNTLFKRHFDNNGRFNLSVAESSFDTWLDGYTSGIPGRKVSIYVKGAIAALILDLKIRELTGNQHSLDDVMRLLWTRFGKTKKGYSEKDYQKIAEEIAGTSLQTYFDQFIYGNIPVEEQLNKSLNFVGCELQSTEANSRTEKLFGFATLREGNSFKIHQIAANSVAEEQLTLGDEIIAVNGRKVEGNLDKLLANVNEAEFVLFRDKKLKIIHLSNHGTYYCQQMKVIQIEGATKQQKENFRKWLKSN